MSILDEINQLSIFDFENNEIVKSVLEKDDKVMIRFYTDEIEIVRVKFVHLLGVGVLIKKKHDFWLVDFDGNQEWIEEDRLKYHP